MTICFYIYTGDNYGEFFMVGTIQNTTAPSGLQSSILASIKTTADNAGADMEVKRVKYENAMHQLNIIEQTKYYALKNLKTLQEKYLNDKNNFTFKSAQNQYNSICENYSDADTTLNALRYSYQSSIFLNGKMSTIAILAGVP